MTRQRLLAEPELLDLAAQVGGEHGKLRSGIGRLQRTPGGPLHHFGDPVYVRGDLAGGRGLLLGRRGNLVLICMVPSFTWSRICSSTSPDICEDATPFSTSLTPSSMARTVFLVSRWIALIEL